MRFKGRKLQFNVVVLNYGGINIAKQQLLTKWEMIMKWRENMIAELLKWFTDIKFHSTALHKNFHSELSTFWLPCQSQSLSYPTYGWSAQYWAFSGYPLPCRSMLSECMSLFGGNIIRRNDCMFLVNYSSRFFLPKKANC